MEMCNEERVVWYRFPNFDILHLTWTLFWQTRYKIWQTHSRHRSSLTHLWGLFVVTHFCGSTPPGVWSMWVRFVLRCIVFKSPFCSAQSSLSLFSIACYGSDISISGYDENRGSIYKKRLISWETFYSFWHVPHRRAIESGGRPSHSSNCWLFYLSTLVLFFHSKKVLPPPC